MSASFWSTFTQRLKGPTFTGLRPLPGSLEKRVYNYKGSAKSFYCPLCSTPRAMSVRPKVSAWNHVQMGIATAFLTLFLFPVMEWRSLFMYFFLWSALESLLRILYKKDVPCPHCGFDATWYKRDVREARRRVQEFWRLKDGRKNP